MRKRNVLRKLAATAAAVMLLAGMVGCGDKTAGGAQKNADTLTIRFSNASSFIFNEIYISPTAANEWADELLGSTQILKSSGSIDVDIPAYDFDNYDILVVDEDRDEYMFTRVPLQHGGEVAIYFGEEGLAADVGNEQGELITTVWGTLEGAFIDEPAQTSQPMPQPTVTGTGNDTNGQYSFTVYNESNFDIFTIHMGVANAAAEHDIDILPETLPYGQSANVTGIASQGDWLNTEWVLYITDIDGETSVSFDVFNPWTVSYVDIYWDAKNGGYVCDFIY